MAHDILTIPISTVASKSVFSIDGWVLDKYFSLLKSDIVEALIYTQDWTFGSKGICFVNYITISFWSNLFLITEIF